MTWWQLLFSAGAGLLLLWLTLIGMLWLSNRRRHDQTTLSDALRLLPDVLRLLRRLTADPATPTGMRVRLFLLLGYLLTPIDLIPDFIPVLGYADDAIIIAIALRAIVRASGPDALAKHWPGTPDGLATLHRLAGIPSNKP